MSKLELEAYLMQNQNLMITELISKVTQELKKVQYSD